MPAINVQTIVVFRGFLAFFFSFLDNGKMLCLITITDKKAKFADRAKITARISHLAVEGKGGRVKSVVTLRGADISHQHTQKKCKYCF